MREIRILGYAPSPSLEISTCITEESRFMVLHGVPDMIWPVDGAALRGVVSATCTSHVCVNVCVCVCMCVCVCVVLPV